MEEFQKQLASITVVKGGQAEHCVHCNDRGQSFPKMSDGSIYVKYVYTTRVIQKVKGSADN